MKLIAWVRAVFWVAVLGVVATAGQTAVSYRSKTLLEQRIEILESARKDQQKRNDAQDHFNEIVLRRLEQDARINPESK